MQIHSYPNWLSNLPTKQNLVLKKSNLSTQALSSLNTSGDSLPYTPKFNFIGSLDSSDNDYTVDDALEQQWYLQGKTYFDSSKESDFQSLSLKITTAPSQSDLDSLQQNLRSDGLDTGIDWSSLIRDFSGLNFETDDEMISFRPEELGTNMDYLTSRYAYAKSYIESNFSGDEESAQNQKLDDLFQTKLDVLAKTYAENVGGFFEDNGVEGEKQKIYNSILAQATSKVKQYSDYIADNPDYADLIESTDKWLQNDDAYMAARLREATQAGQDDSDMNGLYSLHDLEISGEFSKELTNQSRYLNADTHLTAIPDEESIGLDLAVLAMKTTVLTKSSNISDAMVKTIQTSLDGYLNNYVDKLGEQLRTDHRIHSEDERGLAPLEKDQIFAVYDQTMADYEKNRDVTKAIISGAEYGKMIFDQKVNSAEYTGIYRYTTHKTTYWKDFYSAAAGKNAYQDSSPTFQKYMDSWNSFLNSLSSGNVEDINLFLSCAGKLSVTRSTETRPLGLLNITA